MNTLWSSFYVLKWQQFRHISTGYLHGKTPKHLLDLLQHNSKLAHTARPSYSYLLAFWRVFGRENGLVLPAEGSSGFLQEVVLAGDKGVKHIQGVYLEECDLDSHEQLGRDEADGAQDYLFAKQAISQRIGGIQIGGSET